MECREKNGRNAAPADLLVDAPPQMIANTQIVVDNGEVRDLNRVVGNERAQKKGVVGKSILKIPRVTNLKKGGDLEVVGTVGVLAGILADLRNLANVENLGHEKNHNLKLRK